MQVIASLLKSTNTREVKQDCRNPPFFRTVVHCHYLYQIEAIMMIRQSCSLYMPRRMFHTLSVQLLFLVLVVFLQHRPDGIVVVVQAQSENDLNDFTDLFNLLFDPRCTSESTLAGTCFARNQDKCALNINCTIPNQDDFSPYNTSCAQWEDSICPFSNCFCPECTKFFAAAASCSYNNKFSDSGCSFSCNGDASGVNNGGTFNASILALFGTILALLLLLF